MTGARDPSYPDRARIDSDVRYLLRPPSTPWLVWDKDEPERAPLLASSRSSVHSDAGFFPEVPAAAADAAARSAAEPPAESSNVVVTTDIRDEGPSSNARLAHLGAGAVRDPAVSLGEDIPLAERNPRRAWMRLGGAIAAAALAVACAYVVGDRNASSTAADQAGPAAATAATAAAGGALAESAPLAAVEPTPPNLDVPARAASPSDSKSDAKPEGKPEKKGFGRLTIRGAAKVNRVYFDGKLLLGQGARTFMVRCGDHTIAVGSKTDARDVDVPCNGELVVTK